ncbi:hypothetical protein SteCoe_30322 [Stentor coeruleus]|uniref:Uncharacterized protein n=1 Tax=Stentor coeruleus TaxID=5963 RepID=A0A1R2B3Z1_9CILI|nr:hypothetical protein SteCoe_30322 [Stentor coeruleus]
MADEQLYKNYTIPEIRKKIYELYISKRFTKICDPLQALMLKLDSSKNNTLPIEEINFISELCVKASTKMFKIKKFSRNLINLTLELTSKYTLSAFISCSSRINVAYYLFIDGKFEEARKSAKGTLKLIETCKNCTELVPKICLLLSDIYLKISREYEKSLKYSQKALDITFQKINQTKDVKFFKYGIEAYISKGFYYIKTMDFSQANLMIDKAKEVTGKKKLCKHLTEKIKRLDREINAFSLLKSNINNRARLYKTSGSLEFIVEERVSRHKYRRVFFNKSMDVKLNSNYLNEYHAAIKIQSYYRMWIQRKKYLLIIERSVLKHITRKINNINYMITAASNKKQDVIIEASPLISGVEVPKSYLIEKNRLKEFGIENFGFISNLLGWVSIINNRIFVSHKLNRKRLVYKTNAFLQSDYEFSVKIFETDDDIIIQALKDKKYEIVLRKLEIPIDMQITPSLILRKIHFYNDKLNFVP